MNYYSPKRRSRRGSLTISMAIVLAMVVAACGADDDTSGVVTQPTTEAPDLDPPETALEDDQVDPAEDTPSDEDPGVDAGSPVMGGVLTVANLGDPSTLDPIRSASGGDPISLQPLYDSLIGFDPATAAAVPTGLAEAWSFPDPQTLVLTLRDGVKFHDGTDFDAEAAAFNLDRAMTMEGSTAGTHLTMVESIEVTGESEVTIHLNRPDSSIILILAGTVGAMGSPTAIEALGPDFARNPVGSGPFKFGEWLEGDRLTLERNPEYWQEGKPYLDQLVIRAIADPQVTVNALLAGELDMALTMNAADVAALEGVEDITINVDPTMGMDLCYFNFSRPPFDTLEARLALNYAIDREELNDGVHFGTATPTNLFLPSQHWAYDPDLEGAFEFDQDRARELLAEAGYPDGLEISAVAWTGPGQVRKNEIIQAQLAEVGISMNLDVMEVTAAVPAFATDLAYDIFCSGLTGREDPIQTANALFHSTSFINAGGYSSPGMDEALAAASVGDPEERAAAFSEIFRISQEDALYVPLLNYPSITPTNSRVGGFEADLVGRPDLSFLWAVSD